MKRNLSLPRKKIKKTRKPKLNLKREEPERTEKLSPKKNKESTLLLKRRQRQLLQETNAMNLMRSKAQQTISWETKNSFKDWAFILKISGRKGMKRASLKMRLKRKNKFLLTSRI